MGITDTLWYELYRLKQKTMKILSIHFSYNKKLENE